MPLITSTRHGHCPVHRAQLFRLKETQGRAWRFCRLCKLRVDVGRCHCGEPAKRRRRR